MSQADARTHKPDQIPDTERFIIGKDKYESSPALGDSFSWWSLGENPLSLNFSDPTIINLNNTKWKADCAVVPEERKDGWVYLVITVPETPDGPIRPILIPSCASGAFEKSTHFLHLYGHDIALLAQGTNASRTSEATLKFDNPPPRDVALLPPGGYLIIASKTDNTGSWLFHCHIAWHASSGLALQILERQQDLKKLMTEERLAEARRVCANWDTWFKNKTNHWNSSNPFQDDSGV
ncbi:multicopper oxidase-domain-containing protein [Thelonectria olida]|uniref:Multicopper oxidase-domain-containing protein n=1 Tax=Thelonectria olida TaxID=1576542 RepID=A0A9P8VQC3_9HYPO|nr:multicopper oxidase-domain-containing protein [Thelonectria olida]